MKPMQRKTFMSESRQSKRFSPSVLTEKLVPAMLGILVFILLTVFAIIGLSLLGITPSA